MLPLLDDMKDTFNFSFADELKENETIGYDTSGIQAIQRAMEERTKSAKTLFTMGVPYSQINKVFKFGIEEFPGWDNSYVTVSETGKPTPTEEAVPEGERGNVVDLKKKFSL